MSATLTKIKKSPNTIPVPRDEYNRLRKIEDKYIFLQGMLKEDFFVEPPTRNGGDVLEAFKATGLYSKKFLDGLSKGMKESEYFS